MKTSIKHLPLFAAALLAASLPAHAGFTLKEMSPQSKACAECHKKESAALYEQWGASKHYRGNVGCYECHMALTNDVDAFEHYGQTISTIVTPKDCGRCHEARGRRVQFVAPRQGRRASSARSTTCWRKSSRAITASRRPCSPTASPPRPSTAAGNATAREVKIMPNGKPDPAIWPNTGIGRINPDGSEGSCAACHSRHEFSAAQARTPDTCGKCHMGPDHPQIEIYNESKHGIAYRANVDKMNLDNAKWIVGEDYSAAPTCATCHMSATKNQRVTHDVGMRISWNNRPGNLRPPRSLRRQARPARQGRHLADAPHEHGGCVPQLPQPALRRFVLPAIRRLD